jgi:hypothetical protein
MFVWIVAIGAAMLFLAVVLALAAQRWRWADRVGRWCLWAGMLVVTSGGVLWGLDSADAAVARHVDSSCPR